MKTSFNPIARILFARAAATSEASPREASAGNSAPVDSASSILAPNDPAEAVNETPTIPVVTVDGMELQDPLSTLAKLESDWKSACGRICKAVDSQGEAQAILGHDKRSGVTAGKDATRRTVTVVRATVSAVDRASKFLEDKGAISAKDADLWRGYVRLCIALEALKARFL